MTFYMRMTQDPQLLAAAVRREVQHLDPSLPVTNLRTMGRQIDENLAMERLTAALASSFGLLATLLASVGLYGIISHAVTSRTREIGVRLALGAAPIRVLWLVASDVSLTVVVGLAGGVALALAVTRLIRTQLYGVSNTDPLTFVVAAVLVSVVWHRGLCARTARRAD